MKLSRSTGLLCFLILIGDFELVATTTATPETISLHSVEFFLRIFKNANERYPTNWAEFGPTFNLNRINEEYLKKTDAYPLQRHYVFVLDKIPMLGNLEGDVILIRAEPSPNSIRDGKIGRYIISDYMGVSLFNWYSEEKVQQMLAKAGVKELPKPEPWSPATNAAIQSPPAQPSTTVAPDSPLPGDQRRPSNFKPPQNTTPANEVVAVSPAPKTKSWWPVFIIAGIGVIFLLAWRQRQRKQ